MAGPVVGWPRRFIDIRATNRGFAMRRFAFRPSLTFSGRKFKGLRGWAGKPFHPPLTDIPIGAYCLAAAFDVISVIGGDDETWGRDFFLAASYVLIGGAVVSVLAALTGYIDWSRSSEKGTQARRTINAHAWTMIAATVLVLVNIAVRLSSWDEPSTPVALMVLTVVIAVLTALGSTIGGTLVFDYGFNVETAGDSPVWNVSEVDVLPGGKTTDSG
jgi:uncharacterized membrane protein